MVLCIWGKCFRWKVPVATLVVVVVVVHIIFLNLIAYHQREVFDFMDLLIISADAGAR